MDPSIHSASHGIARGNTEKVLATSIPVFSLVLLVLAIPDLWPTLTANPLGAFNLCFAAIIVALLGSLLGRRVRHRFAAAAALLFLLAFAAWQLGALGPGGTEARPWSWGYAGAGLGMAAVAWRLVPTLFYGAAFALLLTIVPALPAGSTRPWEQSWQDGLLTAVMAIVIAAPIEALRRASSAADTAAAVAVERFAVLARTRQLAAQRARLDALAHDTILSTLIVAAQARDEVVMQAVREAASGALEQLDGFRLAPGTNDDASLPVTELLAMLNNAAASLKVPLDAPAPGPGPGPDPRIPAPAAEALLQAASEAIRNAVRHGGSALPRIDVAYSSDSSEIGDIRIRISDDGPGFDPRSVAPERLGIAESILGRMERASGEARIDSAPGRGTTVTLHWARGGGPRG